MTNGDLEEVWDNLAISSILGRPPHNGGEHDLYPQVPNHKWGKQYYN